TRFSRDWSSDVCSSDLGSGGDDSSGAWGVRVQAISIRTGPDTDTEGCAQIAVVVERPLFARIVFAPARYGAGARGRSPLSWSGEMGRASWRERVQGSVA